MRSFNQQHRSSNHAESPRPAGDSPRANEAALLAEPDQAEFLRELVTQHHGAVFGLAYRLTGNRADAEDVVQQTFLTAHRKISQLRSPEHPLPWLFTVARTCWLKMCRRRRPATASGLEIEVDKMPGPLAAVDEIDEGLLQLALDKLSEDFRLVVVMFYFEQLSYREIASQLEIAPGTVMSRLSRAKAQLRTLLDPEDHGFAARRTETSPADSVKSGQPHSKPNGVRT